MHGCTVASDGYNLRCSVYKAFIICEKRKRYRYFLLKALHFICIREIGKKVLYVKFVYSVSNWYICFIRIRIWIQPSI